MSHTSKPTPGPWTIEFFVGSNHSRVWSDARTTICDVYNTPANAHLIAAAPEMLKALKDLLVMMDRGPKPNKLDAALTWADNDDLARNQAKAAIAKAEGGIL